MTDGWAHLESPFHDGERQVQERLGVRTAIESFARRVVRDYLPAQHRSFYEQLAFVMLGSLDAEGRPWASLLPGRPGFMTSSDPHRLNIAARPLFGDPLNETLKAGAELGLLGIQLETRRRNRLSGHVKSCRPEGFTLAIDQAFGNCPQYIQSRTLTVLPDIDAPEKPKPVIRADRFDEATRSLIAQADTFFIATAYREHPQALSEGVDVSHRGGKPGFVQLLDDRSFQFPDFSGNNHFNTVGNLLLNPKAGFLFVDFATGGLVYMTGSTEIVWDGEAVRAFAGAQRLIRFSAEAVVRVEKSLPLRFDFDGYSPILDHTGSWAEAAATLSDRRDRNRPIPYEIFDIRAESRTIKSFYLRRLDGQPPAPYEAGQFLPIRLEIPGEPETIMRTYTLSDAPGTDHYRLSIKRKEGDALASQFLHDRVRPGFRLEATAPRGRFVLDPGSRRPLALVSAGVGITPMIAMANALVREGQRSGRFRQTAFVHGARNGGSAAFADHLRGLAAEQENLSLHLRFSQPDGQDRLGRSHDSEGRITADLLKELLPLGEADIYLCGPAVFVQSLHEGLMDLGVAPVRVRYETFGPAMVLKSTRPNGRAGQAGPASVTFADSQIDKVWTRDEGTLLELAEAAGLNPDFSCRSGICGRCATRLLCGAVDYVQEPSAPLAEDEVLLCCATPRSYSDNDDGCGKGRDLVLQL